jgi:hypothetical protein
MAAKGGRQAGCLRNDILNRMDTGNAHQSLLQVDHDQGRLGVEDGDCHKVSLSVGSVGPVGPVGRSVRLSRVCGTKPNLASAISQA